MLLWLRAHPGVDEWHKRPFRSELLPAGEHGALFLLTVQAAL